ncbi:2-oxoisovalerate dehydrogenase subunit alpha 2, mitochondrial [Morella rubra]|uniref:2-oxoisovalerate dehydrogenase subunit alpha 2, mitochondrial n=1 Tax=Morella rubra TaxID=262757 RepID=A0A6A1WA40_9ROSI|nr:2-oxoisovalerate dehydrogenase subunit alpha 2, mitochondrial [Morella rubra]
MENFFVHSSGSSAMSHGHKYGRPHAFMGNSASLFHLPRFKSTEVESKLDSQYINEDDDDQQVLDFPGGKVAFTSEMSFISESDDKRIPCYQVLDDNGEPIGSKSSVQVSLKLLLVPTGLNVEHPYLKLSTQGNCSKDVQLHGHPPNDGQHILRAQRQGRISFYLTTSGEEAINIASAAALTADDLVLPQYREPGVLLWRGFTLQDFANQCFGNKADSGKARQMPIHYASKILNYFAVSSPMATQLPQAVGVAYSLKMEGKNACVATYCGDGGSSEGDFHAALNFAAVMEAPVLFICRNNGWAISTPIEDQFRSTLPPLSLSSIYIIPDPRGGDGLVVRGRAYGIRSIRVDGNDALAVYNAIHTAREMAISEQRPLLVEALTYRVGHHSTSDDSTKYRPLDEIEYWKKARDPVNRLRKWVEGNGWWNEKYESELRSSVRKQLLESIQIAEKIEKPPLSDLFTDVYDNLPSNLQEQEKLLRETIERNPQNYPSDIPI